jgi:hypothetical protein
MGSQRTPQARFLLLAIPPLALLFILDVASVPIQDSVRIVIWMETISLALWTSLTAWLVGMRGRPLMLAFLAGLVVASIVIILQVVLQPGRARQDNTTNEPKDLPALGTTRRTHPEPPNQAA